MIKKRNSSVIYVNYSPYENSGHILDFLQENFEKVFLFSIAFHNLGRKKKLNKLTYFKNGKIVEEKYLYYMYVPQALVFFLVPVRSAMNALQIFLNSISIKAKHGKIDTFFSVNAFTTVIGMVLKKIGVVKTDIFWVWDYYPVDHPNVIVRIMRWMYLQFDILATKADRVVYLNNRLANVRRKIGLVKRGERVIKVPIGMGKRLPLKKKSLKKIKLGFIGVLKKSQGLDLLFDSADVVAKKFPNLVVEVIGSGPDEVYFKNKAKKSALKFNFYGLVDEKTFKRVLYNCTLGIAPYTPEDSNVSRYGDPGKVKRYLEFNLPAIITNVFEFSKELEKSGAGIVINYNKHQDLVDAISKIIKNYSKYVRNVVKLNTKFYYKTIYQDMFEK